jgi:hypothetical protein
MSYWNYAALRGGSIGDAFEEFRGMPAVHITMGDLQGGWQVSDQALQYSLNFFGLPPSPEKANLAGAWLEQNITPELSAVIEDITSRYNIADMRHLAEVLWYVYIYDTFLANGSTQAAWTLLQQVSGSPLEKRIFDYVRRKVHLGTSRPQKMTKSQREARTQAFYNAVTQRRNFLRQPGTLWVGSNPYIGQGHRTASTYRGLHVGRWSEAMKNAARASRANLYGAFMTRKPPKPKKKRVPLGAMAPPVAVAPAAPMAAAAPAVLPVARPPDTDLLL